MTDPTPEGVMSRIMKLLNLAADEEGATSHERQAAEEMAERLMEKHMVDRFEAEQAAKKMGNSIRKPIQDSWEIYMSAIKVDDPTVANAEFDAQILAMMQSVLKHCNVRVNTRFEYARKLIGEEFGTKKYATDYSRRVYKIVGFPEDIAYAERIWFNVFRTFVTNINPQWDVSKSIEWNAYNFASAGISWKQMVLIAEKAKDDRIEWPWRYQGDDKSAPFFSSFQAGIAIDPGNEPWGRSIHKLKRSCKKYCDDQGLDYPYARGAKLRVASRNSFARSYNATIGQRLEEIRRLAKQGADHVDENKFALAVRDTTERVDEEFYRLFPEFDPEVRRRQNEAAEREAQAAWASLTKAEKQQLLRKQEEDERRWARAARRGRRSYGTVREDPANRIDQAAWSRGERAAQSVNLRNDGEVQKPKTKGIE